MVYLEEKLAIVRNPVNFCFTGEVYFYKKNKITYNSLNKL